jgi:hypothetical protein
MSQKVDYASCAFEMLILFSGVGEKEKIVLVHNVIIVVFGYFLRTEPDAPEL